ncbi:MAG: hypothetical protein U1A27_06010 [Phycisphaerae bacterium]
MVWLTATRRPLPTLLATLMILVGYVAVDALVLFRHYQIWAAVIAPVSSGLTAWAAVTLYRQLTAERQKRFVQAQLAEYTSPALGGGSPKTRPRPRRCSASRTAT